MSDAAQQALRFTNFGALDWGIVIVYLAASLFIGMAVKKFAGSMENYIGAGRKVGPWLGIATMTGSELGLVTVMYSAQKGYTGGFAAFHMAVIAGVCTLFVGLTGFIVGPLRRMEVLTIPEFYEKRFNRRVRLLGAILLVLAGVLNMGLFLKTGSMFIVGVTGLASEGEALMLGHDRPTLAGARLHNAWRNDFSHSDRLRPVRRALAGIACHDRDDSWAARLGADLRDSTSGAGGRRFRSDA